MGDNGWSAQRKGLRPLCLSNAYSLRHPPAILYPSPAHAVPPSSPPPPSVSPNSDPTDARSTLFSGLLLLGGLTTIVALMLLMEASLSPLLVAVVGGVVLWPMRSYPAGRALLMAGGVLVAVYLARVLGGVLAPFIAVFVLAYLLDPVVCLAQDRFGWPRWAPTAILTAIVVGLIVLAAVGLVPTLVGQTESLLARALGAVSGIPTWVAETRLLNSVEAVGLVDRESLVQQLGAMLPQQIQAAAAQIPSLLGGLTRSVGTLIGAITTVALLPVLLFYMLKDYPTLRDGFVSLLPRYKGRREYVERATSVFGNYLRGQLTISAISTVLVAVPLTLFGVPYSLVLGLLAGLLNMIPNLGAILTYVLGVLIMLIFGTLTDLLIVVGVLAVQAVVEQALLTPNIMSQSVGLHPVVVMGSLFVFSALFGFLGLVLAVPLTALLAGGVEAYREALVLDLDPEDDVANSSQSPSTT